MNIFIHELKKNCKSIIIWGAVLIGIAMLFMSFYPTLKNDIDNFIEIIDSYPAALRAAFGLAVLDLAKAEGFYAMVLIYIILFGAIQSANIGVSIASKEERDRTADFLLTKPVSRIKILTYKLLAAFTVLTITNIIFNAAILPFLKVLSTDINKVILLNLSLYFIQIMFFSISFIIAMFLKKVKSVLPVSLGIVFVFYAINTIIMASGKTKSIFRYLTPFQYFDSNKIINSGKYDNQFLLIGLIITIACIVSGYVIYKKKDIRG